MRMFKRLLKILLGILALVVVGALAVFAALQTPAGQGWITARLLGWTGGMVAVEGPGGGWPQDLRLERIEVKDAQGIWLRIEGVSLQWHPLAYLHKEIAITSLVVRKVEMVRKPLPGEQKTETTNSFDWQGLPNLRLEKLDIAEISIAPEVAGHAQRLKLSGAANPAMGGQDASFRLQTLEGAPTEATLALQQRGAAFTGNIQAQEAAGGILGTLLMLDPAQALALKGDGTLNGAQIQAHLQAAEGEKTLLNLAVEGDGTHYHLQLQGNLPGQLASNPMFDQLVQTQETGQPLCTFETTLVLSAEALNLEAAKLRFGPLQAGGTASYPLKESAPLTADLQLQSALAPLSALAGQSLAGQAFLALKASGTLAKPQAHLDAQVKELVFNQQTYPPLSLMADLHPDAEKNTLLVLTPLQLNAGAVQVNGQAQYDTAATHWQAVLTLAETEIQTLLSLVPDAPKNYAGKVKLQLTGEGTGADAKLHVESHATQLSGLPPAAQGVVNGAVDLRADVEKQGADIGWKAAQIESAGGLRVESNGSWKSEKLESESSLHLQNANVLGAGIPGGSPEITFSAKGSMEKLETRMHLAWQPPDLPKLEGRAEAQLTPQWMELTRAEFTAAGARLQAQGKLPRTNGSLKNALAHAEISIPDLAQLGPYIGQKIQGSAQAEAELKQGGASAQAALAHVAASGANVEQVQLNLQMADIETYRGLKAELAAKNAQGADWRIAEAHVAAQSTGTQNKSTLPDIAWNTQGNGTAQEKPIVWNAKGQWLPPVKETQTLNIAQLTGQAMGEKFGLDAPITLSLGVNAAKLSPTTVRFGALVLHAQWAQDAKQVSGKIALDSVALPKLPIIDVTGLPEGTLQAAAEVTGTPAAPKLAAHASGNLRNEGSGAETIPLDWKAVLDWQGGATPTPLAVELSANGPSPATLAVKAQTRGHLQLAPFAFALPPESPLSGQAQLHWPLETLNPWIRGQGSKLAGKVEGDFTLGGTLGAPAPQGALTLAGVRYDHLDSGFCLQGLNGRVEASPQAISFRDLIAKDRDGGQLQLSGQAGLQGARALEAHILATDYQMFCGGLMAGKIGGDLQADGSLGGAMKVAGKVRLGPMNVNLPETAGASGIPSVKVLNEERAKAAKEKKAAAKAQAQPETQGGIALNITAEAPGRIFVRGRGLDAEFGGNLQVGGTASAPDVMGSFSTKRGKFDLLDKQLTLTEGILRFAGPIPPSPSLSITAETKAEDATVKVTLQGPAAAPKLTLSSDPVLPQDEVLARLLFGRQLTQISPYQALQLARAARQLAGGGGGGTDVLGSIRGALGLDTLSVDQDSAGETTVGTGKYLADGVYVGVEQGRTPESRRIRTELEVIPNVNVQTITGSKGETGGGVEWKLDY